MEKKAKLLQRVWEDYVFEKVRVNPTHKVITLNEELIFYVVIISNEE